MCITGRHCLMHLYRRAGEPLRGDHVRAERNGSRVRGGASGGSEEALNDEKSSFTSKGATSGTTGACRMNRSVWICSLGHPWVVGAATRMKEECMCFTLWFIRKKCASGRSLQLRRISFLEGERREVQVDTVVRKSTWCSIK